MLLRSIRWLTFGLIVLVTMLRLYEHVFTGDQATILESARFALFDSFQAFKPRESQEYPVVVVDIDEESLRRLGPWPWPRQHLTELTKDISAMGASAIVIYLSLADTDTMSPQRIARLLPPDDAFNNARERLSALPDTDTALAAAIGAAPVVLGFVPSNNATGTDPSLKVPAASLHNANTGTLLSFPVATNALQKLQDAASGYGSFPVIARGTTTVRQLPLFVSINKNVYPSLTAEALRVHADSDHYALSFHGPLPWLPATTWLNNTKVTIGSLNIATDSATRFWPYFRWDNPFQHISAWKILAGKIDEKRIKEKLVLVGSSASGLSSRVTTPLGQSVPSIAIQAQAIESILGGNFLTREGWADLAELIIAVMLALLLIRLLPVWGLPGCALLTMGLITVLYTLSWHAFSHAHILVDPTFPGLLLVVTFLSQSFVIYVTTQTALVRTTWIAEHDMLTGCFNRRAWYDRVTPQTLHGSTVTGGLVSILDIDFFKRVNDTYGHLVGDEALKHIVSVIENHIDANWLFGRLGGEEFGLFGPDTANTDAPLEPGASDSEMLETIRIAIANTPLVHDDLSIALTTSIGVTRLKAGESLDSALGRADEALYRAKETGRNRVEFS